MALNIVINSEYKLTSDALNIIVNRRFIVDPTKSPRWAEMEANGADPTPKAKWREVAFCTGIDSAIKWVMNQQIRESDAEDLTYLLDEIKRFQREISAILPK
jgi:hypothetical protein